jgi:8-oxo-dGTP diphosphatase
MDKGRSSCYKKNSKFYLSVDCVILGYDGKGLKALLIKRNFEPEKGKWSLMGGFLGDDESLLDAAVRVLFELTGLTDVYLEQLYAFGDIKRDTAGRVVSVAYYALINANQYNGNASKKIKGDWHDVKSLPNLIFDHEKMIERAIRRIRRKAKTRPIGFELLPEKFTIPQLLNLYESIYNIEFDKRNFRKKVLTLNVLEKLPEKDMSSSRKGAYFYKFNKEKYDLLILNGFAFDIFNH